MPPKERKLTLLVLAGAAVILIAFFCFLRYGGQNDNAEPEPSAADTPVVDQQPESEPELQPEQHPEPTIALDEEKSLDAAELAAILADTHFVHFSPAEQSLLYFHDVDRGDERELETLYIVDLNQAAYRSYHLSNVVYREMTDVTWLDEERVRLTALTTDEEELVLVLNTTSGQLEDEE